MATTSKKKAAEPTPTDLIDDAMETEALREEFLSDLPELLPPHRFRIGHRNRFRDLALEALKSNAFDRTSLEYDLTKPEDIEAFQELQRFLESVDAWAESIAVDADAYALWSEGKTENHFMALFRVYQEALGESSSSES